ncbi:GDSL-type esterase/lipase family protein [Streptococcus hyovaginalis]|uniref:GDSL-type esterase/lipase family protein n=1 Tax=Streptococcus hyovaginalis TaxID=149015 RepID=UPI002A91325F|nr:GDSL-type esterase/lipase family protein [Streptococcus hyovaginalis]MDY5973900.1 GDSL-type esterase/lipase family protein [Streptococcus hyovaginalis]
MKRKNIWQGILIGGLVLMLILVFQSLSVIRQSRKSSTAKSPIAIAAVGDSITFGAGVAATRETDSYPALLEKALGKEYRVVNYGLSGRTLLSNTAKPYFKEALAKKSFQDNPDMVIIMLGTNDSRINYWREADYKKEYLNVIKRYQKLKSKPTVYVMIPPKVFFENPSPNYPNNAIVEKRLRKVIPEIAEKAGVAVIDQYDATKDHPEWFPDQLHPDLKGNQAIVKTILKQTPLKGKLTY